MATPAAPPISSAICPGCCEPEGCPYQLLARKSKKRKRLSAGRDVIAWASHCAPAGGGLCGR